MKKTKAILLLGAALRHAAALHRAKLVGPGGDQPFRFGLSPKRRVAVERQLAALSPDALARNIVRFARRGQVTITVLADGDVPGVRIVARDAGPGIADIDSALVEGYSTYGGLGLGIPGARRLMDEFDITSEVGRGTTVTMTKWHRA